MKFAGIILIAIGLLALEPPVITLICIAGGVAVFLVGQRSNA
jgi:uncharacterized membrane protein HdeD (DUF308 family)